MEFRTIPTVGAVCDRAPFFSCCEKRAAIDRAYNSGSSRFPQIERFPCRGQSSEVGKFPAGRAELSADEAALKQITWPVDAAQPNVASAANPAPPFPSAAIWRKS